MVFQNWGGGAVALPPPPVLYAYDTIAHSGLLYAQHFHLDGKLCGIRWSPTAELVRFF
jgi:hypothetical protein